MEKASKTVSEHIKFYTKKFDLVEKYDSDKDYESAHIQEDLIMKTFLRDLVNDKFNSMNDAKTIATLIKKSIKNKNNRFYS